MPKGLCEGCELFVHATYERLLEFDMSQQKLVSEECETVEDQDYLRYYQEIQLLFDRINDLKRSISQKKKRELYHEPIVEHDIDSNLKVLLLKHESVKSLKRICIDFVNEHGPNLLDTYLKFELPPLTEEEELAELQQQQELEKHTFRSSFSKKMPKRGGKGRFLKGGQHANSGVINKKKSNNFVKSIPFSPMLDETKQVNMEENQELGRGARRRSRALSRVNYAEDIPDSILFYDEIQSAKRRKLEEKVILESIKEAKRSQMSPTPGGTIKLSNIPRTEEDVKQKLSKVFKSHPGTVVQINSSLSIKLKTSDLERQLSSTEQAIDNYGNQYLYEHELDIESESPTNELFFSEEILPDEMVYVKHECPICGLICDDMKALALHNNSHLTLRIQRYGERQLLMASLRRGNMVIVNGRRIVRCSNCLRTFANAEQIKQHWNTKMCMFYCKICSMSFHRNPEKIREHSLAAHGVILDKNRGMTVAPPLIWRPIKMDKRENEQIRPPALAPLERLVNNLVKREVNNEQTENSNSNNNGQSHASQNPTPSGFTLKVKSVSSINASASNLNGNPGGSGASEIPPLHFPQTAKKKTSTYPVFSSMLSKQVPPQRATCHICHCSFPNTNSRNSHMKVHKRQNESPSFASNRPIAPPPLAISVPKMITQYTKVPQQQQSASVSSYSPNNPTSTTSNNYTIKVNLMTRPCGFRYYNRADFLKHRSECKECRYACTQCSKNFQSGSELQMHYMLSHPKSIQYFKR